MAKAVDKILGEIRAGNRRPVYLVSGDLVLAVPEAARLAAALAEAGGCNVLERRRPAQLGAILADLKTYSLFTPAKVVLVVDAAVLGDRGAAADLIDQAEEGLPVAAPTAELSAAGLPAAGREAASRLLQALRLFGVDPRAAGAEAGLSALPDWVFEGGGQARRKGKKARTAKARKALREGLLPLLEAALAAGLVGFAESDLAELGEVVERGLPAGHALVLAEGAVDPQHPIVETLVRQGAAVELGHVEAGKDGQWQGLSTLTDELARETGVRIAADALEELARRTLRQSGNWGNRTVEAGSTARLAAEYRKLAAILGEGTIRKPLVEQTVQDRGEEDVWQILDALGGGRGGEAVARFRRLVGTAEDTVATRLSFFNLLAGFCRQLAAIAGMMKLARVPPGERSYNRFKDHMAPALQAELPTGGKSPLAGLHPFRLYRAYLAASRIHENELALLPWRVLETEMRVKGESSDPDAAIAQLMAHVAAAQRGAR